MSKKKRNKNRLNFAKLAMVNFAKKQEEHVCPKCGEQGTYHYVQPPLSLEDILEKRQTGYWLCNKPVNNEKNYLEIDGNSSVIPKLMDL